MPESIRQSLDYFELRVSQIKDQVKATMSERISNFCPNHDIDVEIEYMTDHLNKVVEDQIMSLKISHLKQNKEVEQI